MNQHQQTMRVYIMLKFKKDGKILTFAEGAETILVGFDRLADDNSHVHEEYEMNVNELVRLQERLNELLGNDY